MSFGAVEQAIADIRGGKLVIVADDERRENEGDLVGAAERVTPAVINFMATHARGLICMPLTPAPSFAIMRMALWSCQPQSQRADPKTSPVRHLECIRTSTFGFPATSPYLSAICSASSTSLR